MIAKNRFFPLIFLAVGAVAWGCSSSTDPAPPVDKDPYSVIEAFIGNGEQGAGVDGVGPLETPLYWPQDMAIGPDGRAYVIDWNNYRIRVVENGKIRTLIGSGNPVPDGESEAPSGPAREVDLNHPAHISFDAVGNIILSGFHSSAVFHFDFGSNYVQAVCGNGARTFGGDGGPATTALVNLPVCSHYDEDGYLYIMDQANQRLRVVEDGIINTFVGTGVAGFSGDGGPPQNAQISLPVGQQAWPSGKFVIAEGDRFYIADTNNNRVRLVQPEGPIPVGIGFKHENFVITTVAGNGTKGYGGDGGPATAASLNLPNAVAVDSQGNFYISDTYNHVIRKVDTSGIITTFAGHPQVRVSPNDDIGNGGHPRDAYIDRPAGIFVDDEDNVYIADLGNNQIRVIRKNP